MHVRVLEARHHEAAREVDDLDARPDEYVQVFLGRDGQDPIAGEGQPVARKRPVPVEDGTVAEDDSGAHPPQFASDFVVAPPRPR